MGEHERVELLRMAEDWRMKAKDILEKFGVGEMRAQAAALTLEHCAEELENWAREHKRRGKK